MKISSVTAGPFQTNSYLLFSGDGVVIIDPTFDSKKLLIEAVGEAKVVAIWLTHSHIDHIADVAALKRHYDVPVFVHPLDAPNLETPGADRLPLIFPIEGVKADRMMKEGDELEVNGAKCRVLHLPGHSPGSVGFYFEKEKVLIGGDVLFKQGIGNLSFPTAEPQKMKATLERLANFPEDVKIYPGHGEVTTIGDEKQMIRSIEWHNF